MRRIPHFLFIDARTHENISVGDNSRRNKSGINHKPWTQQLKHGCTYYSLGDCITHCTHQPPSSAGIPQFTQERNHWLMKKVNILVHICHVVMYQVCIYVQRISIGINTAALQYTGAFIRTKTNIITYYLVPGNHRMFKVRTYTYDVMRTIQNPTNVRLDLVLILYCCTRRVAGRSEWARRRRDRRPLFHS